MITFDEFIKKWTGKPVDFDGIYPNQCMDLMHQYSYEVLGITDKAVLAKPSAYQVYSEFSWDSYFKKVANTPTGVPDKGDLVVFDTKVGQWGHVCIFVDGDAKKFNSFDANFPTGSLPHIQSHDYVGVSGWLKPIAPTNYIKGLDVSVHQGDIDFNLLETDFLLIKATEGVGFTDQKFKINQTSARNKGILLGYYHFARPDLNNTATEEADWFLKTVDLKDGEIVCLDFEVTYPDKVKWCKAWLDRVFSITKCKPLIYLNKSTAKGNDWSSVIDADYGLWLADYNYDPDTISADAVNGWKVLAIRQYSNKLPVSGIIGGVDANVFYGDEIAFKAYGYKTPELDIALQKELDDMRASRDKWKLKCSELEKETVKDAQSATEHIKNLQSSVAEQANQISSMNQTIQSLTSENKRLLEHCGALGQSLVDMTASNKKELDTYIKNLEIQRLRAEKAEKSLAELKAKLDKGLGSYTKWQRLWSLFKV